MPKWGRRKSWIIPVQAIVGVGLWVIGGRVEGWLEKGEGVDIGFVTTVFGGLILAAATQGEFACVTHHKGEDSTSLLFTNG